jgi:hypothetical protein
MSTIGAFPMFYDLCRRTYYEDQYGLLQRHFSPWFAVSHVSSWKVDGDVIHGFAFGSEHIHLVHILLRLILDS